MRRHKFVQKAMISASLVFTGGAVLGNGCINMAASANPCGTVFTFCTPADWVNMWFPLLEVPDFDTDPSCTIPLGCGSRGSDTSDVLPPLVGGPGGGASSGTVEGGDTGTGGGSTGGGGG